MDCGELHVVTAVAEAGSLAGAARTLRVNVSTISRRLQAVEASLGTKMFLATHRGQTLTPAGQAALETATAVQRHILQLRARVANMSQKIDGPLRVTCPPTVATHRLMQPLASFVRTYPGIEIHLMVTDDMVDIGEHHADIAIRVTETPPPSLVGRRISRIRYAAYASMSYLKAKGTDAPHQIILPSRPGMPALIEELLPNAEPALVVDDHNAMIAAAEAGVGVALLPRGIADALPSLHRIFLDDTEQDFSLWLLTHADMRKHPRIRVFMDYLYEELRKTERPEPVDVLAKAG